MEGKSKAKVTPRVSSGRARIQEKRQRSRLGVEVDGWWWMVKVASRASRLVSPLSVDGAKTLADFLGERKTVSSRSKPTSHSLAVELPLHIGDREQVEGMRRLPPGTRLEHLLE